MQDINEQTITASVIQAMANAPDLRVKAVMTSLVKHLHAFIREVEPSEAEWMFGIEFLTRTGKACSDVRQEFILLSDTLGVTTLVDAINHRNPSGATDNSVLGPFFFEERPVVENGADLSGGLAGDHLYFEGRVVDVDNKPVAGALVDVWHSDGEGHYDVMLPGYDGSSSAMRGLLKSDSDGRFWFHSILPHSYPIPGDGPVGEMMRATKRSNMRPAHVHVLINAPGFERLTTMVFVAGDPHIDTDPVFGVKKSLVHGFVLHSSGTTPDGREVEHTFYSASYDFGLAATKTAVRQERAA